MENQLGELIRTARMNKNLTLKDLDEKTGVSYSHLSKIERGKFKASKEALKAIGEALDLDVNQLYLMSGYPSEELQTQYWETISDSLNERLGDQFEEFKKNYNDDPRSILVSENPGNLIRSTFTTTYGSGKTHVVNMFLKKMIEDKIRDTESYIDQEKLDKYNRWERVINELEVKSRDPEATIYYFHDKDGNVLYAGHSKKELINKRIKQHLMTTFKDKDITGVVIGSAENEIEEEWHTVINELKEMDIKPSDVLYLVKFGMNAIEAISNIPKLTVKVPHHGKSSKDENKE